MDDYYYDYSSDYDYSFDDGNSYGGFNDDVEVGFIGGGYFDDDSHGIIVQDNLDEDGDEFPEGGNFGDVSRGVIVQDNLDEFTDGDGFVGGGNFGDDDAHGVIFQGTLDEISGSDVSEEGDQDGGSSLDSDGRYEGQENYNDIFESEPARAVPFRSGTRVFIDDDWLSDDDQGVQSMPSLNFDGTMSSSGFTGAPRMVPSSFFTRVPLPQEGITEARMRQFSNRIRDAVRTRDDGTDTGVSRIRLIGDPVGGTQVPREAQHRDWGVQRLQGLPGGDVGRNSNETVRTGYGDNGVRDGGRGQEQRMVTSEVRTTTTVLGVGLDDGAKAKNTEGTDSKKGANVDVREQKEKGEETSSNKDVGIEDKELIRSLRDGFVCAICMLPWTNDGDHAVGCLPCGHLFGMSCITTWLEHKYPGKCPQCNMVCYKKDVTRVYGLPTDEFQEKIKLLESKLAEMQLKSSSGEDRAGTQESSKRTEGEISKRTPGESSIRIPNESRKRTPGVCKGRSVV